MNEKELAKLLLIDAVKKAIRDFGVENAEDKIRKHYKRHPYLRYRMLKEYFRLTGRKDQRLEK